MLVRYQIINHFLRLRNFFGKLNNFLITYYCVVSRYLEVPEFFTKRIVEVQEFFHYSDFREINFGESKTVVFAHLRGSEFGLFD